MEEQARLLETLASTRAAYDALHGQLEAARQTELALRAELEKAEAVRVRDQRTASEQVAVASAADTELRLALGTARGQLEVLLSERDALKAALDIAQKASLGAEEQATERILAARRQATAAEAAREELARKVELQESELKALRTQLTQDTGGRELLALRDRVRELSESYEGKSVALAQVGDSLEQARSEKEALQKQLSEALHRGAELERKVEEASAENLKADNEVLRGLVRRQKSLNRRQSVALIALRSARIFLRTLQSVGILLVLGLAALALDALPEGVKLAIRTWLGIP
jgi:chromosome segregation ATPase